MNFFKPKETVPILPYIPCIPQPVPSFPISLESDLISHSTSVTNNLCEPQSLVCPSESPPDFSVLCLAASQLPETVPLALDTDPIWNCALLPETFIIFQCEDADSWEDPLEIALSEIFDYDLYEDTSVLNLAQKLCHGSQGVEGLIKLLEYFVEQCHYKDPSLVHRLVVLHKAIYTL